MNKNPEATKQYLVDRIGRAGAELCQIMGSETTVLPVTGEDKLYVAVGTLAGISQVAGKSFDEAAGNTNKAVLTDEGINDIIRAEHPNVGCTAASLRRFARAIEAAVLSNASKAEPVAKWVNDEQGFQRLVAEPLAEGTQLYAAPAPADNPSTAGAEFDEQAGFESWARATNQGFGSLKGTTGPSGDWYYFEDESNIAWDAWKARASLAAPVAQSTAGAAKGGIAFDESELRKLILYVSNTSHWCGRIGGDADDYEEALNRAVAADEALFNYVRSLSAPASPAQPSEAEVRDQALEEAAQIAANERDEHESKAALNDGRQSDIAFGRVNSAERIAEAIRGLKGTAAQSAGDAGGAA